MSDREETYIYESPDRGHTVYRRKVGNPVNERELHFISEGKRIADLKSARQSLWHEILTDSEQDPALKHMLDQVEVYYRLKSQP